MAEHLPILTMIVLVVLFARRRSWRRRCRAQATHLRQGGTA
jgi:hypothetical protein